MKVFSRLEPRLGLMQCDPGQARWLEQQLGKATGATVTVRGVLALPGWFVANQTRGNVAVMNPPESPTGWPGRWAIQGSTTRRFSVSRTNWGRCRLWSRRRSRWAPRRSRRHDHPLLAEVRGPAAGFSPMEQQPGATP